MAPTMLNPQGICEFSPFPAAMGQNSKMRKIFRMIKEIKSFVGPNMQANRRAALIEYVPLFFWLIFRPLVDYSGSKEVIESVCITLRELNLSIECFKEHVLTLLMCGEDEEFNQLPTATKTALTKAYNKLNASSIKPVKKARAKQDDGEYRSAMFDPDVQDAPSDFSESDVSQDETMDIVPVGQKAKATAKGRGTGGAGRGG